MSTTREELLDSFAMEAMKLILEKIPHPTFADDPVLHVRRISRQAYLLAREMIENKQDVLSEWKREEDIEQDSIDKLGLSVRAEHILKAGSIFTVAQLVSHRSSNLLKLPNMGKKSLQEIIDQLAEHGYKLRGME